MSLSAVLAILCLSSVLENDAADASRIKLRRSQYDSLFIARCEAKCAFSINQSSCSRSCLTKNFTKPGQCPKAGSLISSPFAAVCMKTCQQDSQCSALSKCCHHSCGVTCQQPDELSSVLNVPNIPEDVRVAETSKKRTISIEWKPNNPVENTVIVYIIEERHHTGRNFIEERLTDWATCAQIRTHHLLLRNFIKPGRWYQFRVAAVNENGTKGFSAHSATFSVSLKPKAPKAPQNVSVGPLWVHNGTLQAELRWAPPLSDLPIQKYKVFWSRRLHGARALDSVLVHHRIVPKEDTRFLLRELKPNSLYFLQVQALVQFGKNRLKGEKSGLVLNTTNFSNVTQAITKLNPLPRTKVEKLHLQKLFWSSKGLRARVSWQGKRTGSRYTISWWTGPCYKHNKEFNHLKYAATTKGLHYDLYDLEFNCRYRASVREISNEAMRSMEDTSITFITPNCEDFKLSYRKAKCFM